MLTKKEITFIIEMVNINIKEIEVMKKKSFDSLSAFIVTFCFFIMMGMTTLSAGAFSIALPPTLPKPTPAKPVMPTTVTTPSPTTTPTTKSNLEAQVAKLEAQLNIKQAKITKLTVKSKSKKKINVTWKKVSKAKGYQVQVSAKKTFKKIIFNKDLKKTKLTIKNKKIKSKKTYYVRVRAYTTYKDVNNKPVNVYSSWSKKTGKKVKVK